MEPATRLLLASGEDVLPLQRVQRNASAAVPKGRAVHACRQHAHVTAPACSCPTHHLHTSHPPMMRMEGWGG